MLMYAFELLVGFSVFQTENISLSEWCPYRKVGGQLPNMRVNCTVGTFASA